MEKLNNEQLIDLAILPMGGTISPKWNDWQPTAHGKMRCDKLIALWKEEKIKAIEIIGGRRVGRVPNEADVYYDYMCKKCPDINRTIVIVDAQETCTNRDLPAAYDRIQSYFHTESLIPCTCIVGAVSYKKHLDRIEIILRYLSLQKIERILSGETSCYFPLMEWVLIAITRVDPEWRWLGRPLVWLADKRLYKTSRE